MDRPGGVTFRRREICREISQFREVNRGLAAGALNLLGFFPMALNPCELACANWLATLFQKSSHESLDNTLAK